MEQIDQAARRILTQTGMRIDSDEAVEYLRKAGCLVDPTTQRVRFPAGVTTQAVDRMRRDYQNPDRPERMAVRYSHVRFRKTPHCVHEDFTVSSGGFCCFIHDLENRRRLATRHDVLCAINMVNQLEQINYTGLPVADQTIPAPVRPVVMAAELAKYTQKIGGIETFDKSDVELIAEIAQIAAGSPENFRSRPIFVGYAEIRSPLCFDRNMVEIFMEYIKRGIPQTVDTMPSGGTTAPMTAAGILALGAAETLAAVVLAYAIREDAVISMDINPSYADMSTGLFKYGGADRNHLLMARIQLLAEYYGCPTGVHGGKTNSCFYDEQAGAEKISSILLPVLAGAVGIGTIGHIENAVTFSPVQLLIDHELVRFARRCLKPSIEVSADTLALDLIDRIGPGGTFLDQDHTAEHFREELFFSPLFPTLPWEQAHKYQEPSDIGEKARETALSLWKIPDTPVLDDDQLRAVDGVIQRRLQQDREAV
jgi:trimethylamine--corrinoid protein Co-methyltransferase